MTPVLLLDSRSHPSQPERLNARSPEPTQPRSQPFSTFSRLAQGPPFITTIVILFFSINALFLLPNTLLQYNNTSSGTTAATRSYYNVLRRRLSRRLLVQLPVWVRRMPVRPPHPPPHPPPPVTTYVFVYRYLTCTYAMHSLSIAHEATAQGAFQIGSSSSPRLQSSASSSLCLCLPLVAANSSWPITKKAVPKTRESKAGVRGPKFEMQGPRLLMMMMMMMDDYYRLLGATTLPRVYHY